ncbi:hypothetical protein [Xenorhabdus anantnagensis]|uniref:Uncharacterized protein n=1 Tax=Xenorhabdus anantnagensis TaxID=3025875 RepID=A0ABT5LS30_9GAMM|nr:hypothetical protein [Xenorhabdus anantnagensis]MDC9596648.1 hypothetical protein [Xenorhabdus anantnagensis]
MLKIKRHKEGELTYYTPDLFKNDGPLAKPKDAPMLSIKLHRINEDFTETLVFKKTYSEPDSIAGTADGILWDDIMKYYKIFSAEKMRSGGKTDTAGSSHVISDKKMTVTITIPG